MASSPIFELFEAVCTELAAEPDQIVSEDRLDTGMIEAIKDHFDETSSATAFKLALGEVDTHLKERGGLLPFTVDLSKREFAAVDKDYLEFVAFASNQRSIGGDESKAFEIRTLHRLRTRLTGDLHRVGHPRDRRKTKAEIVEYLRSLGFEPSCFQPRDRDGGLDILWLPPLSSVPLRPIISFQCKNSFFDEEEANSSAGRAERTLSRHTHLKANHIKFVVFNDYIDRERFVGRAAGWTFMPLGLTDLASPAGPGTDVVL